MARVLTRWWFWVLAVPGAVLLMYIVLLLMFLLGTPTVARNFSKELNEPTLTLRPDERADTVYRKAAAAFPDMPEALLKTPSMWPQVYPGDPEWDAAQSFAREAAPSLALVRQAASMPHMGFLLTNVSDVGYVLGPSKRANSLPTEVAEENPMLIGVLLPHLGTFRAWARTFEFDMRLARSEGDADRAHADALALLGLARHADESPFLISHLVAVAIRSLACNVVLEALQDSPGLWSDAQLAAIERALSAADSPGALVRSFDGETAFFEDTLQRVFTDDGRGGGHITYRGFNLLKSMGAWNGAAAGASSGSRIIDDSVLIASGPLLITFGPNRKETMDLHARLMSSVRAYAQQHAWTRSEPTFEHEIAALPVGPINTSLVSLLFPAMSSSIASETHGAQAIEATRTAVALERYRLAQRDWPTNLGALVPMYLSAPPTDHYDGTTLKYRLSGGRPIVYSVGCDGKDDGGAEPAPTQSGSSDKGPVMRWMPPSQRGKCPSGDWVFWPVDRPKRPKE